MKANWQMAKWAISVRLFASGLQNCLELFSVSYVPLITFTFSIVSGHIPKSIREGLCFTVGNSEFGGVLKNTENKSNECVLKWLVVLITSRGSKKFFFFQDSKLYVLTVYLACSHMNFSVYVYWPRFQSSRIQSCGICLLCKCQLTWATFWPSAAFQTCLIKKVNVIIR